MQSPRSRTGRRFTVLSCVLMSVAGCAMPPDGGSNGGNGTPPQERFVVTFDGDGGATARGTTDFEFGGAGFSGGTVRTVGDPSLYGTGLFAYEVTSVQAVSVVFERPVVFLELFFVARGGGQTALTAFDDQGMEVGSADAVGSNAGSERTRTVALSAPASRVEIEHTGEGDGWVDCFTFEYAEMK